MDSQIDEFLKEQIPQPAEEVDAFVKEKLDEYAAQIERVTDTAFTELNIAVSSEIQAQVDLTIETDLDEIAQCVTLIIGNKAKVTFYQFDFC